MRKYFTAFIAFGFLAVIMTFVCIVSFKPIDSLMKPPMSSGENREILLAFEEALDKEYKLRVPLSGEYRSSFISEDLNGDGQEEIIVLYSTEDEVDIVKISYMMKKDGEWKVLSGLESSYSEVHQVKFSDIDNDGTMEMLVGWTVYNNDLSRHLNVYKIPYEDNNDLKSIYSSSYLMFETLDIDSNGVSDIAIFEATDEGTVLSYNRFTNGAIKKEATVALDSSVYTVYNLSYDNGAKNNGLRMYVDSYKIDSGIITECIYFDKSDKQFRKVESNGISVLSSRFTGVTCQDVNGDGLIDIPLEIPLEGSAVITKADSPSQKQDIIKWICLDANGYDTVSYQLIYNNNDFRISFSEKWMNDVTVINNYIDGSIMFYSVDDGIRKELFELRYTSTQLEEDSLDNKYKLLTETDKGKLFYIIYNSDRDLNINKYYLEKSVINNGG